MPTFASLSSPALPVAAEFEVGVVVAAGTGASSFVAVDGDVAAPAVVAVVAATVLLVPRICCNIA